MPEQKTPSKPTVRYTSTGKPEQTDERGTRKVQEDPKDQKATKKAIGKGAGKAPPASVGMGPAKGVRGDDEQDQLDAAHELIRLLATSRDPEEHAKAMADPRRPAAKPTKAKK